MAMPQERSCAIHVFTVACVPRAPSCDIDERTNLDGARQFCTRDRVLVAFPTFVIGRRKRYFLADRQIVQTCGRTREKQ